MIASPKPLAPTPVSEGLFAWWTDADARAHKAFIAASLGWMLDSFDVMLYAIVLASLIEDPGLNLTRGIAGALGSVTLLAAAGGGIAFGVIADRVGRKQALMMAVLIYSIFTAACGFAQTAMQLAVFRILLGVGMGGEWATGVALVSETFPGAPPRQSAGVRPERLGDRLRPRGARQPHRHAALGLARRVLRRRAARALHAVDPPEPRGAEDVAER